MSIEYLPGKLNAVADILSRRSDHMPNCPKCRAKIPSPTSISALDVSSDFSSCVRHLYELDPFAQAVFARLRNGGEEELEQERALTNAYWIHLAVRDGLIFYKMGRLYIPDFDHMRMEFVQLAHDALHLGIRKMLLSLTRYYIWPSMSSDVSTWVSSCDQGQRNKHKNIRNGLLQSLPIPTTKFTDVAMGFFLAPSLLNID